MAGLARFFSIIEVARGIVGVMVECESTLAQWVVPVLSVNRLGTCGDMRSQRAN